VTPHPGEFARLVGIEKLNPDQREERAKDLAIRGSLIVVLKGHKTVVTDGHDLYVNTTGNPGMATGGCGDVLTGVITALVGQGLSPFAAAQLGVYVHGLAGDLAADALGQTSLIASDLLRYLPEAFKRVAG
jgi:NAD(P)H-hydrate epimerase